MINIIQMYPKKQYMIFYDTCNLTIYNNRARLSRDILIDRIFIVIIHYSQLMRIFAPENKDIQRFNEDI